MYIRNILLQLLLITLISSLAVGCTPVSATPMPIPPTPRFMIAFPTATFTHTPIPPTTTLTPTPAPTLTPTPISYAQDIHTLCLETTGDLAETIFDKMSNFMQQGMEMQVLPVSAGPCDAILSVATTAEAISEYYYPEGFSNPFPNQPSAPFVQPFGSRKCYNGARIRGEMNLARWGQAPAQVKFAHAQRPPSKTNTCLKESSAPFDEAWPLALLEGLANFWGPHIYVQALYFPHTLGDEEIVVLAANEALQDLSGQEYRADARIWAKWLEEQPEATPFRLPVGTPVPTPRLPTKSP